MDISKLINPPSTDDIPTKPGRLRPKSRERAKPRRLCPKPREQVKLRRLCPKPLEQETSVFSEYQSSPETVDHISPLTLEHVPPSPLHHFPKPQGQAKPRCLCPKPREQEAPVSNAYQSSPSTLGHVSPSTLHYVSPSTLGHASPSTLDHISPSTLDHVSPSKLGHVSPWALGHVSPSTSHHILPSIFGHVLPSTSHYVLSSTQTLAPEAEMPPSGAELKHGQENQGTTHTYNQALTLKIGSAPVLCVPESGKIFCPFCKEVTRTIQFERKADLKKHANTYHWNNASRKNSSHDNCCIYACGFKPCVGLNYNKNSYLTHITTHMETGRDDWSYNWTIFNLLKHPSLSKDWQMVCDTLDIQYGINSRLRWNYAATVGLRNRLMHFDFGGRYGDFLQELYMAGRSSIQGPQSNADSDYDYDSDSDSDSDSDYNYNYESDPNGHKHKYLRPEVGTSGKARFSALRNIGPDFFEPAMNGPR